MRTLEKTKNFILDILFPVSCISCGKENTWLCEDCLSQISPKREQVCPVCEKNITPDGRVCFFCRKKSALNGLLVAASYQNKTVAEAVHYYKYRFVEDLHVPLGEILIRAYFDSQLPVPDLIIPVPLHKRRLRYRGFNQAEILAQHLGRNLAPGFEVPIMGNLLIRSRYTRPQMEIKNYTRRRSNIQNAFKIKTSDINCDRNLYQTEKDPLNNKSILLVDDIATTGSTIFECAKVLKQNGAKEVFGVVVARQEINSK